MKIKIEAVTIGILLFILSYFIFKIEDKYYYNYYFLDILPYLFIVIGLGLLIIGIFYSFSKQFQLSLILSCFGAFTGFMTFSVLSLGGYSIYSIYGFIFGGVITFLFTYFISKAVTHQSIKQDKKSKQS